jgi:transposase-like protein
VGSGIACAQEAHVMSHHSQFAAVRRQLGQDHDRSGQRSYSESAKRAAIDLARLQQRDGHSIASTARALGIHPYVLGTWLRRDALRSVDLFAPVVITDAHTQSTPSLVVTHAPSGLRIEGLSITQIAELLRGLR